MLNSALSKSHSRQKPEREPLGAKTEAHNASRCAGCVGFAVLVCWVLIDMVAISSFEMQVWGWPDESGWLGALYLIYFIRKPILTIFVR